MLDIGIGDTLEITKHRFRRSTEEIINPKYRGLCVFDYPNNQIPTDYFEKSLDMTIEKCLSICRSHGLEFSGLQYRSECHCFRSEPLDGFQLAWPDKCNMQCTGDKNQICGGEYAMSIWSTPLIIQGHGLCVYDFPDNRRVFDGIAIANDKTMTLEKCAKICMQQGT